MIVLLPETSGNVIGVKVIGKLTDADFVENVPGIEAIFARHGKVRFLVDLTEFDGWDWQAAWDDFAFGIKHWGDIEKMAVITDSRWEGLAAKFAGALMHAQVKSYDSLEIKRAWAWTRAQSSIRPD